MEKGHQKHASLAVCRFCLGHKRHMWSLEALHRRDSAFLFKVYQCSNINIIDVRELYTWVCKACLKSIEKFYTFKTMLQRNKSEFEQRFQQEQLESALDWKDSQLLKVSYDEVL